MKGIFKKIIVNILTFEAKMVLKRFKPKIAVVSGSVGKTSTKDAIAVALSVFGSVRKSEKSLNSEIGVPLAILGLQSGWNDPFKWFLNCVFGFFKIFSLSYEKWLVLELGADKPRDLLDISKWIRPRIVVITRIPKIPVHVEFYSSPEAVFEEETRPIYSIEDGGVLILNFDDERVRGLAKESKERVLFYGLIPGADVVGVGGEIIYESRSRNRKPKGFSFIVSHYKKEEKINIFGALGMQHMYPVLAGFAAAISEGASIKNVAEKFKNYKPPLGRMNLIDGLKKSLIIDDSYNSSPEATIEALRVLRGVGGDRRKIAVLGDMKELGIYSIDEHKRVGKEVSSSADILITVGWSARFIAEGALNNGMKESSIFQFDNAREAGNFLEPMLGPKDIVLVKGSQSMRMEKIVLEIMAHPERADRLLVRQEEEWRGR